MGTAQKTITLINDIAEVARAAEIVEEFCASEGVPGAAVFQINVVVEELLVNTISYGFPDGGRHEIVLEIAHDAGAIVITLTDDGQEFDPLQAAPPDLDAPLDERPIGGLGIHFVRTMMDEVHYERVGGRNRLTLKKRLDSGASG